MLIARLTAQLRCYEPEPVDETWGRLRHLGARREQLITGISSQVQQMRSARVRVAGRVGHRAAAVPVRTWIAALTVIVDRDGGEFARIRRLALARFEQAVRREISNRGGQKPCRRITRSVLDELKLTALVTSITGISAVGAAAILAQTAGGRDESYAAWRHTLISTHIWAAPPVVSPTRSHAAGTNPIQLCRGRRQARHRPNP